VDKIGKSGAVVKVKDGFARNFLMPKGLAIEVTSGNLKKLDEKNQKISLELEKKKGAAEELKARLDNLSLTIPALVEGEESLYGSITALDIYNTLKEEGVELDKDCIILNNPIKALGVYEIPLKLHSQVEAKLKVWVVKK